MVCGWVLSLVFSPQYVRMFIQNQDDKHPAWVNRTWYGLKLLLSSASTHVWFDSYQFPKVHLLDEARSFQHLRRWTLEDKEQIRQELEMLLSCSTRGPQSLGGFFWKEVSEFLQVLGNHWFLISIFVYQMVHATDMWTFSWFSTCDDLGQKAEASWGWSMWTCWSPIVHQSWKTEFENKWPESRELCSRWRRDHASFVDLCLHKFDCFWDKLLQIFSCFCCSVWNLFSLICLISGKNIDTCFWNCSSVSHVARDKPLFHGETMSKLDATKPW